MLDDHLLLISRRFVPQEHVLGPGDFVALWSIFEPLGGLAFYNGGAVAGASQPHRHLQWVPTPFEPDESAFPTCDALFDRLNHSSSDLPFQVWVRPTPGEPEAAWRCYRELLELVGAGPRDGGLEQGRPYNLLLTHTLMAVVPRVAEGAAGIGINSLGFAGSLLVPDRDAVERVRAHGVGRMLAAVSGLGPERTE